MSVRKFLDEHDYLYSDLPKRTAADVPTRDLMVIKTDTGLVFAVDRKTGAIFRNKKEWSDKDSR
jgi:hypothetical protein